MLHKLRMFIIFPRRDLEKHQPHLLPLQAALWLHGRALGTGGTQAEVTAGLDLCRASWPSLPSLSPVSILDPGNILGAFHEGL